MSSAGFHCLTLFPTSFVRSNLLALRGGGTPLVRMRSALCSMMSRTAPSTGGRLCSSASSLSVALCCGPRAATTRSSFHRSIRPMRAVRSCGSGALMRTVRRKTSPSMWSLSSIFLNAELN
jgi:hypothetical protein